MHVLSFYKFQALSREQIDELRLALIAIADEQDTKGLIILAPEGINVTIAGNLNAMDAIKKIVAKTFDSVEYKESRADTQPFKRFSVKVRAEIVTLEDAGIQPQHTSGKSLSPEEWHAVADIDGTVILDARNTYETDIGIFEGALDPRLKTFSDFTSFVRSSKIPKKKKVLMYCPGGIRRERAALVM